MNWYEKVQQKPEIILCAAILRKSKRDVTVYHEGINDISKIEIGYRHHDILQRFKNEVNKHNVAQGFYTSKGRFVTRCEAMYIAFKAGQVPKEIAISNKEDVVQFMNDMVIGDLINDNIPYSLERYHTIDTYYKNKGFNQLFSEDLY